MLSTLVASWFGCGAPYRPVDHDEASFPLVGGHAGATCEGCHGPPPFAAIAWDTTCLACHEVDRKAADHYAGQGCASGEGCHAEAHLTWAEAAGVAVAHEFLPLEGAHALECAACHTSPTPGAGDVLNGGTSQLCWSCHEVDRKDLQHYVENPAIFPQFLAEPRWDCKACHDAQARNGAPIRGWGDDEGDHGEIRFPHGLVGDSAAVPPEGWITACADCHPDEPPFFGCTDSCHLDLFAAGDHYGTVQGDAARCLDCHPKADLR